MQDGARKLFKEDYENAPAINEFWEETICMC